ncbi:hypothetical protein CXB51_011268 [Gossypium anomalum]|uniref:Uncharacterized protein n=1 Tax=Gossypium anomalum TaxID=47600 RepID=A0A8J5ZPI5_9ROSI|nr:hypothetical protein CXB51_011268 [Gossypium anomalum]
MSPLLSTHHFAFSFPSYLLRFSGLDLERWCHKLTLGLAIDKLREMNNDELMGLEKMVSLRFITKRN